MYERGDIAFDLDIALEKIRKGDHPGWFTTPRLGTKETEVAKGPLTDSAIRVLDVLKDSEQSLTQASKELRLSVPTVHRHAKRLVASGHLVQIQKSPALYEPGPSYKETFEPKERDRGLARLRIIPDAPGREHDRRAIYPVLTHFPTNYPWDVEEVNEKAKTIAYQRRGFELSVGGTTVPVMTMRYTPFKVHKEGRPGVGTLTVHFQEKLIPDEDLARSSVDMKDILWQMAIDFKKAMMLFKDDRDVGRPVRLGTPNINWPELALEMDPELGLYAKEKGIGTENTKFDTSPGENSPEFEVITRRDKGRALTDLAHSHYYLDYLLHDSDMTNGQIAMMRRSQAELVKEVRFLRGALKENVKLLYQTLELQDNGQAPEKPPETDPGDMFG